MKPETRYYNGCMPQATPEYEPRYLAGIVLFNRHDYFEAHEVWESLWMDPGIGADRRFVQALIQAAVALYHFGNGNHRGARKLFHSSRAYMEAYGSEHLGLSIAGFWQAMQSCFEPLLAVGEAGPCPPFDADITPYIALKPEPAAWPDPAQFCEDDD